MIIKEEIQKIVLDYSKIAFKYAQIENASFENYYQFLHNKEIKILLIVGHVNSHFGDGHSIAVLNPDKKLCGKIIPNTMYEGNLLNRFVKGNCDAMFEFTLESDINKIECFNKYVSKNPKNARMTLSDLSSIRKAA